MGDQDTDSAVHNIDSISGYNANVVTLTVRDELSRQIAQYVASTITDELGNAAALA